MAVSVFAGAAGIEPTHTVLETVVLPLYDAPIVSSKKELGNTIMQNPRKIKPSFLWYQNRKPPNTLTGERQAYQAAPGENQTKARWWR